MSEKIIDGKAIAAEIKNELKNKISNLNKRAPGLAVILVGDDPASHYYVSNKEKSCAEVGIVSFKTILAANCSKEELISIINKYNQDPNVDGILLQLPLPAALKNSSQEIIDHILANKDVDGLTTINLGKLVVGSKDAIEPCTPKGCMELLKRSYVNCSGKQAIVLGRSTLVGKPISLLLNAANATVTMAHSKTQNLEALLAQADIIVAAIGQAEFIKANAIKVGAVIIDVGINAIEIDGKRTLVGDVEFTKAFEKASLITPVPGGVGPMTVAMLLANTLELYEKHI